MNVEDDKSGRLLLYGRRRGRALRSGQRKLFAERLPQLGFTLPPAGPLDPSMLFAAPPEAVWLELGFGAGEHMAAQAADHPAIGIIGAEVYENGVAKLVADIERRELRNIRIYMDDGRALVARLAPRSIARAFVLFPDPWPKERHKKRRLVAATLLDDLARAMVAGAELRLATDDPDYGAAMQTCTAAHAAFAPLAEGRAPWAERPADWPPSRYEQKAITAGRFPLYLRLARRGGTSTPSPVVSHFEL